jgi:hypothetical protein
MISDLICLEKIFTYMSQRAMSCCLYKHMSWSIVIVINTINRTYTFHTFGPSFYSFRFSSIRSTIRRHNLQSYRGSHLSIVQTLLGRRRSISLKPAVPLTAIGPDKIGPSDLPNRTVQFTLFQAVAPSSCSFRMQTHFGDSTRESTTSST